MNGICVSYCTEGKLHSEEDYGIILPVVPIALTDVVCTGNETALSECSFNIYDGNECDHNKDVIVNCNSK